MDPSSSGSKWRFKRYREEATNSIKNGVKNNDLTKCPIVFRNTHIRKSLSKSHLFSEEIEGSVDNKSLRAKSVVQKAQNVNLPERIVFKDVFGSFPPKTNNRSSRLKPHNDPLLPTRGRPALGSELRSYRPTGSSRTALSVINFDSPNRITKVKPPGLKKSKSALGCNTGAVYGQQVAVSNTAHTAKNSSHMSLLADQNFDPVARFSSEWRLDVRKAGAQSDSSSLTCTFRVNTQNRRFTKT